MFHVHLEPEDLGALPRVCVATGARQGVVYEAMRFPVKTTLSKLTLVTAAAGVVVHKHTFVDLDVPIARSALSTLRLQRLLGGVACAALCVVGAPVCMSVRDPTWMMATVVLFVAPAVVCMLVACGILRDRVVAVRLEPDGRYRLSVRSAAAARAIRKHVDRTPA